MKSRDIGWLLLTSVLAVALLHTRCTSRPKADYALDIRDSTLAVTQRELDSLRQILQRRETNTERERLKSDRRVLDLRAAVDRSRARMLAIRDSLAAMITDSVLAALMDSLTGAQDSTLAGQDRIIAELSSQLDGLRATHALQGSLLAATQRALDDMTAQRDAWRERVQGPRIRLYWGLGAGVVLSGGQWHAGPGVFVGIAVRF